MKEIFSAIVFALLSCTNATGSIKYKVIESQDTKVLPSLSGTSPFEGHSIWFRPHRFYQMQLLDEAGEIRFSKDVHVDQYDIRITHQSKSDKKSQHLILSGCSFIFGDLVNDEETVASQVGQLIPGYDVVNLGRSGSSVLESVFLWSRYDVRALNFPPQGIHVFTMIDAHFERIVHTWRVLDWMREERPVYRVEAGQVIGPSQLSQSFKYRFMGWIKEQGLSVWWLRFTHWFRDFELMGVNEAMALYLLELKNAYLKQYPQGRFVVTYFLHTNETAAALVPHLKRLGIEYWEPPSPKGHHEMYRIPNDGHPSPLAYKEQAEFLAQKIKELK